MANEISCVINLCSVDINATNQIDFKTRQEQIEYFTKKITHSYYPCRYQPRTATVKVTDYVEEVRNSNYGFYSNTWNGKTKTYFFWIVNKNYMAAGVTEITIQIDVIQTWLFEMRFKPCMIERCHTDSDRIGDNTYPEDFELGDYISQSHQKVEELSGEVAYFLAVTDSSNPNGAVFGRTYAGYSVFYYSESSVAALTAHINRLCDEGKGDAIAYIFCFPKNLVKSDYTEGNGISTTQFINKIIKYAPNDVDYFRDGNSSHESYKPYNQKLYTYPYNFIALKNSSGSNVVLKIENFLDKDNIEFCLNGLITLQPTFMLSPCNYSGRGQSLEDSIEENGFGLCSWNNDNYANWYAQHQNSIQAQSLNAFMSFSANSTVNRNNYEQAQKAANANYFNSNVNSAIGLAGSVASANVLGAAGNVGGAIGAYNNRNVVKSGIETDLSNSELLNDTDYSNTMRSLMASVKDAQVQPNTCKGSTAPSGLDMAMGNATFWIDRMSIKPEYAKKIDMYFQMFGYQVNSLDNPKRLMTTREKWNYIKSVNCNCIGDIPTEDIAEIERIFNNGITFWHKEEYLYNYEQKNDII